MLAFILAGIVVVLTLGIALFIAFASGMSDAPFEKGPAIWPVFVIGFGLAALLVGSHYLRLSW